MRSIEHTIDIAAPPAAVWAVLTDVANYPDWNPFMTMAATPTAIGDRLSITVRTGRRSMSFRPKVTAYEQSRQIAWLGRFLAPHIVDGAHSFTLEALADGGTRFRQREEFSGFLVPFLSSMLANTESGFATMNTALAERVMTGRASHGGS